MCSQPRNKPTETPERQRPCYYPEPRSVAVSMLLPGAKVSGSVHVITWSQGQWQSMLLPGAKVSGSVHVITWSQGQWQSMLLPGAKVSGSVGFQTKQIIGGNDDLLA